MRLVVLFLACAACSRTKSDPTPTKPEPDRGEPRADAPGVHHKITPADLPPPGATDSVDNGPHVVPRSGDALPRVPEGFRVELFADKLTNPRMVKLAPNGDVFVVESKPNRVTVIREGQKHVFAKDLKQPFGIAFTAGFVYVANTDSVVRFPYEAGDLEARGAGETVVDDISGGGRLRGGGHWTRDIVFSKDEKKMFVSVGSLTNVSDDRREDRRARIFEYSPDGKNERVYATGIRNPVGLAIHPETGELWTSVNERDELGDDLPPDYVTRVKDGGFYGWPWFYIGKNEDPRHVAKHPELRDKVIVPDVLIQAHSASLGMTFYTGKRFGPDYENGAFAAQHGSWNRQKRTGYKVIFVPTKNGAPASDYVDFMTGFVLPNGDVWGRPVAVAETKDGALLVTDDGGDCIWRVTRP